MRREVDPDIYCPQAALVDEETSKRTERRLARYRAKYEAEKLQQKMLALRYQRQQWMAGGALVAAALGWLWYRKYVQRGGKGRRIRRGGGENLSRDLFLEEDDDGFDGTEEELLQVFNEAAKVARKLPDGVLDQRDQLMLYGLYKQAKEGDRNIDAPSKINAVAIAKYDAWGKFKGLPKPFAMKKYCEVVYHFSTGGDSSYGNGGDDNADVVYEDDKQADLDEDGCPLNQNENENDFSGMTSGMGMGARQQSTLLGVTLPYTKPQNNLRNAAISNDAEELEQLIEDDCDVDEADESGQTALHFAADRGSADCLKLLVDSGANVNAVDSDGIGVLQTALSAGLDVELVRLLLEAGADPDAVDEDGDSSRDWVEEEGDGAVVELFAAFPAR